MNKQQWHAARRLRHVTYEAMWGSKFPELRDVAKGSLVPSNTKERVRNFRFRLLRRALQAAQSRRPFCIEDYRRIRAIS